jgi:hypothetical protein
LIISDHHAGRLIFSRLFQQSHDLLGINKDTEIQKEFVQIDARTLKKLKIILALPKHQRHIIYSMAESFLKQNQKNQ